MSLFSSVPRSGNTGFRRQAKLPARLLCAAAVLSAGFAHAEEASASGAIPSPTATENLARLMVEKNVITKEQADAIIAQSREEVARAKASAETPKQAPAPAAPATPANNEPVANGATPPKDGVVRVQYVPESVKQQLREDIKQEVMAQAKAEGWAQPDTVPEWVNRFKFFGDIRIRLEHMGFPAGNDTSGVFPDFNAINNGAPYDVSVSNNNFAPQKNVDQDRDRVRLRARFGADINLGEDFTAGLRLATGNNDSPVSANQTFGQSGNFAKYNAWVDRAFIKYDPKLAKGLDFSVTIGRFDNPFFASNMIWDEDLGFDGFVVKAKYDTGGMLKPFVTAGAFPIYNTDFDLAINQPTKFKSNDKWLYAGQLGTDIKVNKDLNFKVGGAFYCFENMQGRLSSPYTPLSQADAGDTDDTRPLFSQGGNTYMALRNITPDASNGNGTTNQWQYFGLAAPFRMAALTARADYGGFDPVHLSLVGEFVKNVAFNSNDVDTRAVNNFETGTTNYKGGDIGWDITLNFGSAALEKRWDWIVGLGYRYVESDAVVDGLTDSDLGGGGTNLQGYSISGSLALSKYVWVRARWLSAESIVGPTYRADTVMFDITARF